MRRSSAIEYEFVDVIPGELREGTVYISTKYATVVHKCCCGCGSEVVTPLSPAQWTLKFDGETISLTPSIGNWGFPCQSHYWIRRSRIDWASEWSRDKIAAGRRSDRAAIERRYASSASARSEEGPTSSLLKRLTGWMTAARPRRRS